MTRRIGLEILISIVQVIIACMVFVIGWEFGSHIHEPSKITASEGAGLYYFLRFSILLFSLLVLVANILDAVINKPKWKMRITIIVTIVAIVYWGRHFNGVPYKTLLYIVTILITIASKFLIERLLIKRSKSTNA